jgi:hypothetical protein
MNRISAGIRLQAVREPANERHRRAAGQDAISKTVVLEDRTEGFRDDRPEPVFGERPDCVLTARAAPEIVTAEQNGGSPIGRM